MSNLPSQTINPGSSSTLTIPPGTFAIKVSNTSPYDLLFSGYGTLEDDWMPSGTEYVLYHSVYDAGLLNLSLVNNRNFTPANAGVVLLTAYLSEDAVPLGSWPVSIPQSVVNTSSVVASSVVNNGSTNPTSIVSAIPQGKTDTETNIYNNGSVILGGSLAGDDSGIIQLNEPGAIAVVSPPTGTGSITLYMPLGGAPQTLAAGLWFKIAYLIFNNLQNTSASKYTMSLPAAQQAQNSWFVQTTQNSPIEFLLLGSAKAMNVVSAIGTLNTGATSIGPATWGAGLGQFDTLRFGASDAGVNNGIVIIHYR